ncbi:hypothetical protein BRD02_08280 [Halobacteriales archaeon QS_8_69_73]|nr:MAG: hypothetical protein BRD02_08280 [Halobacteriales archaeon QS_8_69_73]
MERPVLGEATGNTGLVCQLSNPLFHVRANIDDAVEVAVAESQPALRPAAFFDDEALFLHGRLMANGVPATGQRVGVGIGIDVDGVA